MLALYFGGMLLASTVTSRTDPKPPLGEDTRLQPKSAWGHAQPIDGCLSQFCFSDHSGRTRPKVLSEPAFRSPLAFLSVDRLVGALALRIEQLERFAVALDRALDQGDPSLDLRFASCPAIGVAPSSRHWSHKWQEGQGGSSPCSFGSREGGGSAS